MFAYAITIFLSAFLLFALQPLMGKFVLPWFGGGSGVWMVCLLFFQTVLLAGYAYAHAINTWLQPRRQVIVHGVMLLIALAFLPITPREIWKPTSSDDPTWRIFLLLMVCVGGPYLLLASTGPLMQAWFARAFPNRSPYRLYALSNFGSLLALLAYPFLIEPWLPRGNQTLIWSIGFGLFASCSGWCAWLSRSGEPLERIARDDIRRLEREQKMRKRAAEEDSDVAAAARESIPRPDSSLALPIRVALWIILPACSTALLLAVTSHLTEEVAPIPLLWVLPLSIYLVSFIICFEWPRLYHRGVFAIAALAALPVAAWLLSRNTLDITTLVSCHLAILAVCCMACHGELFRRRPEPRQLTLYYLMIAAGGALGGAFVSVLAPHLFSTRIEYQLALFASAVTALLSIFIDRLSPMRGDRRRSAWAAAFVCLALIGATGWYTRFNFVKRYKDSIETSRNFYGALNVNLIGRDQPANMYYELMHGNILHGAQMANPAAHRWATMYYGELSGIGRVMGQPRSSPWRVGMVGLGVGTLATYGRSGDVFRFYEINPDVIRLAHDRFTYLAETQATVEIVLGDARLSLEREPPQHFDVLVLDAFSGDAIPIHLLTRQAFELYDKHMTPDGVIAVHISNRYLALTRVLAAAAGAMNYRMRIVDSDKNESQLVNQARWVFLTRSPTGFRALENAPGGGVTIDADFPKSRLWTDDYASVLEVMYWFGNSDWD